jgi:CrcB protein
MAVGLADNRDRIAVTNSPYLTLPTFRGRCRMPSSVRELLRAHRDLLPAIAAGGALGSLARWGLAEAIPHAPDEVAWATVIENVSGTALMGLLMAFVLGPWSHTRYLRPFLAVGALGGYTTFSTYVLDARGLLASGSPLVGLGYLAGTVVAALVGVWLGVVTGRLLITAATRRRGREIAPQED